MPRPWLSLPRCLPEILLCAVGFAASLVPSAIYSDPFWGVDGFIDRDFFAEAHAPGVKLIKIASGSPAAATGLKKGDRILSVSGRPATFHNLGQLLDEIRPGEEVTFDVRRDDKDLRLVQIGEKPTLSAVTVFDWQFVSAPLLLGLVLLLIATQSLNPVPLWRAIVVMLGGLSVVAATFVVELTRFLPWTIVWQTGRVANPPSNALHYSLAGIVSAAGLLVAVFGAMSIRSALLSRLPENSSQTEQKKTAPATG